MHEELNQFVRNYIWMLVLRTENINVIGTTYIFRNKMDKLDIITRNKAKHIGKGIKKKGCVFL